MTAARTRRGEPWPAAQPGSEAAALLFCLPYAGGSASVFRSWPAALAGRLDAEVLPVELPGHGRRIGEPPGLDVPGLAAQMAERIDRPYVVMGHSLGARLGFELCRALRDLGVAAPERLIVSGSPAPRLPRVGLGDSQLPDEEFIDRVTRMGGTPAALFEDPETRELFLPVMRSDFAWGDAYRYREAEPLVCGISAFAGSSDAEAPPEQMAGWEQETSGDFRLHAFEGGHFFLNTQRPALLDALVADLPGLSTAGTG